MAITRQTRRAHGSSPTSRATRIPPSRTPTTHNRKGGLTNELIALGVIPNPRKINQIYDGPGYKSNKSNTSTTTGGESIECAICAETQEQ